IQPRSAAAHVMQGRHLSSREVACLHWSSLGKTSWETGLILGVTERTVNFHIGNACHKLGVNNRGAAIAIAVRQRLLPTLVTEPRPLRPEKTPPGAHLPST